MNLLLDPARCQGYGLCAESFGAIEIDEFGYAVARRLPIAEPDLEAAKAAVAACPNSALRIEK